MYEISNTIPTVIPESFWKELPFLPQKVELLGQGNNAIVLLDRDSGDVTKVYGHNDLLSDPYIFGRISRHFASEVIAMERLSSLDGFIPTIKGHGRIHPAAQTDQKWFIQNAYGWIRMSYVDGIRQDYIANEKFGQEFEDSQLNKRFYHSIGAALGRLHEAGNKIDPGEIQHDIHEDDMARAQIYTQRQYAKWEIGDQFDRFKEKRMAMTVALQEFESSNESIMALKDMYGFNHGDFAMRNLLYKRDEDAGQISASAIIDFGEAGIALPEYDFLSMDLGSIPAAVAGYRSAGGDFSPERYALLQDHRRNLKRIIALGKDQSVPG